MAKLNQKAKKEAPKCISVGGQAVMEGVMMQGPEKIAMAVRRPDGKVALTTKPVKKLSDKYPFLGWPVIRGVVNFVAQLASGMKMLMESAEMAGAEEEEPSAFEKKVAEFLHVIRHLIFHHRSRSSGAFGVRKDMQIGKVHLSDKLVTRFKLFIGFAGESGNYIRTQMDIGYKFSCSVDKKFKISLTWCPFLHIIRLNLKVQYEKGVNPSCG